MTAQAVSKTVLSPEAKRLQRIGTVLAAFNKLTPREQREMMYLEQLSDDHSVLRISIDGGINFATLRREKRNGLDYWNRDEYVATGFNKNGETVTKKFASSVAAESGVTVARNNATAALRNIAKWTIDVRSDVNVEQADLRTVAQEQATTITQLQSVIAQLQAQLDGLAASADVAS